MRILIPFLLPLLLLSAAAQSADASDLSFEPNRGQTGSAVRYLARTPQGVMFFTDHELVLRREGQLRFELLGADASAPWEPVGARNAETSYFVGRDESKWVRGVPGYSRLARRGIYPGIDAVYYGSGGKLEYDFVVAPHADPSPIRFAVRGARKLALDETGALLMETPDGLVRQRKPEIYQVLADGGRRVVEGAFRRSERSEISFDIGAYDSSLPLVIDPVIESSTYFGGSGEDSIVAYRGSVTVGMTSSIDFPGAEYRRRRGRDIFVKGASSVYDGVNSTAIYGGNGDDVVTGADLSDTSRGVMVFGYTDSADLPTNLSIDSTTRQPSAWQADYGGGASDGFILTVARNQSYPVLYLSYVGGPGDDQITGAATLWGGSPVLVGSTTGRGLPAPAYTTALGPGGGMDGFLLSMSAILDPFIRSLTYFGGTGDDRPLGVVYGNDGIPVVTGETSSNDFPLVGALSAQRAGDTDAFLIRVASLASKPTVVASTLLGGSGSDRGVKLLTLPNGDIALGGVTSSPDLTLLNPIQAAYGGGASDVFVARLSQDLSRLGSSTYFGGSGADELTALTMDSFGSILVGGFTNSGDFPVKNAVQPSFGGGADDGFFFYSDWDGTLYQSTYLGGSGSDRILGLTLDGTFSVLAYGQTSSPDFPAVAASQNTLAGNMDGFLTRINAGLLGVGRVISGKNLRANITVTVGKLNGSDSAEVSARSSDPSKVLVSERLSAPGRDSATLEKAQYTSTRGLYVDCLADSGGADLTLSAPGYADRVVHANCYPAKAVLSYGNASYVAANEYSASIWSGPARFMFSIIATNPSDPSDIKYGLSSRPGGDPVAVRITNSNTKAGTLSTTSLDLGAASDAQTPFQFQPLALGDSTITFSSPSIELPPAIVVHVTSPIQVNAITSIASGLTCGFRADPTARVLDSPPNITFTSLNPEIALLTFDSAQPGSPTLSTRLNQYYQIFAQGVAEGGTGSLVINVTGQEPVTTQFRITPPVAGISNFGKRYSLTAGESGTLTLNVATADGYGCSASPGGSPLRFALDNSNPGAVEAPSSVELPVGVSYVSVPIRAVGDGTATISLRPPDGMVLRPNAESVTLSSRTRPLRLDGIELGKDLLGYMDIVFPLSLNGSVPLTVTSSDPTLVLLSNGAGVPGQGQITGTASNAATTWRFYVHGLADSGEANVTVDAGSLGTITAAVRLVPAGWVWSTGTYTATLFSTSTGSAYYRASALDPATLMPVTPQGLRYGMTTPAIEFDNSNRNVVETKRDSGSSSTITLLLKAAGTATLTLRTPAGFREPSRGQQLTVNILPPSLSLAGGTIGKDLQLNLNLTVPGDLGSQITIRSSDPSKLILTTDPTAAGSGSVVVSPSQSRSVYVQALDNHGSVTVTASAPGYNDASAVFGLAGSGVALSVDTNYASGSVLSDGRAQTTTQSPVTPLLATLVPVDPVTGTVVYNSSFSVLRGGVPDIVFDIQSSDSRVGVIQKGPGRILANSGQTAVEFKPLATGDTDVTLVQPAGFTSPVDRSKFSFTVTPPGWLVPKLAFGKDTFGPAALQMPNNVQTSAVNVPVTLTSTDPSRLLLGRDAETAPSASVIRTLVAGQRTPASFFIHALGNIGSVPVRITAPGYADTVMDVALTDTAFGFESYSSDIRAVLQAGAQPMRISVGPAKVPDGYSNAFQGIRPGVSEIPLTIRSSDTSVVEISAPSVVFTSNDRSAMTNYRPVAPGRAVVTLVPPAGFLTKSPDNLSITVEVARLSLPSSFSLGRDLQTTMRPSAESSFREGDVLTITSSDPTKILVADSATAIGQGTATIATQPGLWPVVYLNALAATGSVSVTVSAPGYAPAATTVNLVPSAAVFNSETLTTPRGVTQKLNVSLTQLDPSTLKPIGYYYDVRPRPGANLSVPITSSDTSVAVVPEPNVTFTGTGTQAVTLNPVGIGTALVSLGLLPGGESPASGRQTVVNVVEPDISLPDFTLGYHLQVPVRLKLRGGLDTLSYDNSILVSTNDQYQAALSNSAAAAGGARIAAVIRAGQRESESFYVQGRGQNGSAQLQFDFQGRTYNTTVTLDRPAFIIKEATGSPVTLPAGATASTYTIVPAVTAEGTPLIGPASIAPQASSKTITIGSTNTAVATVSVSSVTFAPGDSEKTFTVRPLGAGTATIVLSGDASYYLATPASKLDVVVK